MVIMMKQGEKTRNKILSSSNQLFYQQGYHQTSFSDLVKVTNLSKGNITYHFKSKNDILNGVFKRRLAKTETMLNTLTEQHSDAHKRLLQFVDNLLEGKTELTRYGCPNGTLACELGKSDSDARKLSQNIFNLIRSWLSQQFQLLGSSQVQSNEKAQDLLTRIQGICVFSQIYDDENYFEREIKKLIPSLSI